jgi:DNA-binding FrmR family transcriptional regulator
MARKHVEVDAACGCAAADGGRKAVAVDPDAKSRNLNRLRRIEGQVRGLQKMVEEDRWCADVLTQVAAVTEALRGVSRELLKNHLRHCVAKSVAEGPDQAEATIDELVRLFDRHQ